jgi:hypothetical protein
MSTETSNQDWNPNPTGKGGFGDNPQNINRNGHWNPKNTFSYQMSRFKNMTIQELDNWNMDTPREIRTVAEDLAFHRVYNARKELAEFREVADRTEGKPRQPLEHSGGIEVKGAKEVAEGLQTILNDPEATEGN